MVPKFLSFRFNGASADIPSIGLMRGIASAMVCYFHLAHENPLLPADNMMKQLSAWGWTGVEIFFIISGFVIPYAMYVKNYSIGNIGLFLKKRLIRIEPPYFVSIILVLGLMYISSLLPSYRGKPFNIDWVNVATHIGYLNIFTGQKWLQDVYWTLAVEFQFYLLISVTFVLIVSKKIYFRLLFFMLFLAMVKLPVTALGFIFTKTPFFMLGILLFQYYCRVISNKEFWIQLLINLAVLYFLQGFIITVLGAVTLLLIAFVKKVPAFLRFLGIISFSLYLVHIPIGGRIINLSEHYITNIYLKEIMVLVAFGFCILVAFGFYKLVEEKCKHLAASIGYANT